MDWKQKMIIHQWLSETKSLYLWQINRGRLCGLCEVFRLALDKNKELLIEVINILSLEGYSVVKLVDQETREVEYLSSPYYVFDLIKYFRPEVFALSGYTKTNSYWWDRKDTESRIKALDKLLHMYNPYNKIKL